MFSCDILIFGGPDPKLRGVSNILLTSRLKICIIDFWDFCMFLASYGNEIHFFWKSFKKYKKRGVNHFLVMISSKSRAKFRFSRFSVFSVWRNAENDVIMTSWWRWLKFFCVILHDQGWFIILPKHFAPNLPEVLFLLGGGNFSPPPM